MVVFKDEPEKYSGPEVLQGLEKELATCMELDKQILNMDEEIQVNPQYVKKASGTQEDEQPSKTTYTMWNYYYKKKYYYKIFFGKYFQHYKNYFISVEIIII